MRDIEAEASWDAAEVWVQRFGEGQISKAVFDEQIDRLDLDSRLAACGAVLALHSRHEWGGVIEAGASLLLERPMSQFMEVFERALDCCGAAHVHLHQWELAAEYAAYVAGLPNRRKQQQRPYVLEAALASSAAETERFVAQLVEGDYGYSGWEREVAYRFENGRPLAVKHHQAYRGTSSARVWNKEMNVVEYVRVSSPANGVAHVLSVPRFSNVRHGDVVAICERDVVEVVLPAGREPQFFQALTVGTASRFLDTLPVTDALYNLQADGGLVISGYAWTYQPDIEQWLSSGSIRRVEPFVLGALLCVPQRTGRYTRGDERQG